jgi:hypothetical protein
MPTLTLLFDHVDADYLRSFLGGERGDVMQLRRGQSGMGSLERKG